ncbi:hypothetical protein RQP53_23810 [Paucibacter sp. APW11]|uniref:HNH nuclease domain-containing protein n=1 Tax=Roseateles aquae TaxID=3077235 RepID=A0ABU3PIG8_9BURK|nr:hypothetical protein [Paucibacter sp. APW11]MDT9002328.1 hypothetical protein [Paucibacter sp. APW11]
MIYIRRNWDLVPNEVRDALAKVDAELEAISDEKERKAFIEKNCEAWSPLRKYLGSMSHEKCWYSEASERVSRYEVDHFRPHGRAKQASKTFAEGYCWLAFKRDNFRLAGQLCNRTNKEHSEETVGKGDWFPLVEPEKRATRQHRDTASESPVLLDPCDPEDPYKLWFNDDGNVVPDPDLDETTQNLVEQAIIQLGLRQTKLNKARASTLNKCRRALIQYKDVQKLPKGQRTERDIRNAEQARALLLAMASPSGEFAAAVRCFLIANGLKEFARRDELAHLAMQAEEV